MGILLKPLLLPFRWAMSLLINVVSFLFWTSKLRRMTFTTSLYIHLMRKESKDVTEDELMVMAHELNELLLLDTKEEKALYVPILLHDSIWGRTLFPDKLEMKRSTIEYWSELVVSKSPKWLRYDNDVMKDDAAIIIRRYVGRDAYVRREMV